MVVVFTSSKGGMPCRFPPPAMVTTAAVAVVALLMMNTINSCSAAVLLNSNATYERYCVNGGAADENCLIAEDLELEFLMDSHVSRILAGNGGSTDPGGVGNTQNRDNPANPCGNPHDGQPYCRSDGQRVLEDCNSYDRSCQPKPKA